MFTKELPAKSESDWPVWFSAAASKKHATTTIAIFEMRQQKGEGSQFDLTYLISHEIDFVQNIIFTFSPP